MIRLRRHTDGRVALSQVPDRWKCFDNSSTAIPWSPKNEHVSGPGWSELLVAALPEPDRSVRNIRMAWTLCTGELTVGHLDGELESPYPHTIDSLRSDALKMLAAVAACEQYRAQQEAT